MTIYAAARRLADLAAAAVQIASALWRQRIRSDPFLAGLLGGAGLTAAGLHQVDHAQPDLVLAITLVQVTTPVAQIAVLAVAVAVLIGFLVWSKQRTSDSFFRGVLAGTGLVLSFDIVWVHWIFGLHHITNTQMDLIVEPLFVLVGLVFLWFGITRERHPAQ